MVSKYDGLSNSRRTPPLNDSMKALSVGFTGPREIECYFVPERPLVKRLGDEFCACHSAGSLERHDRGKLFGER